MMFFGFIIFGIIIYLFLKENRLYNISYEKSLPIENDPLTLAKLRLAKGEITIEQYEIIKKNLTA